MCCEARGIDLYVGLCSSSCRDISLATCQTFTFATLVRVLPPEPLFFNGSSLWGRAHMLARVRSTVGFPESVAAGNERHLRWKEKWEMGEQDK